MWHPGDIIAERYRIDMEVGRGGMGAVYRGTDIVLDRAVAIKTVLSKHVDNPVIAKRFAREARVAAALVHPHVVRVFDFGSEGDSLFMVMELLEGIDLLEHIYGDEESPLSAGDLLIIRQVADALAAAHAQRLIHRDVKPENVFLCSLDPMNAKLADFGLGVIIDDELGRGHLTVDGGLVGTPGYIAPERLTQGRDFGPPSDVYSLGCVLFEIVTKRLPFEEAVLAKLLAMHLHRLPPDPRSLRPSIPAGLSELMLQMLAKEPAARPTAGAVARRLDHIADFAGETFYSSREGDIVRGAEAAHPPLQASVPEDGAVGPSVAVWNRLSTGAELALRSFGVVPRSVSEPSEACDEDAAIIALNASLEEILALVATGRPVLTAADAGDMVAVRALLRAGVADVVTRPIIESEIVRKLQRIMRRAR